MFLVDNNSTIQSSSVINTTVVKTPSTTFKYASSNDGSNSLFTRPQSVFEDEELPNFENNFESNSIPRRKIAYVSNFLFFFELL